MFEDVVERRSFLKHALVATAGAGVLAAGKKESENKGEHASETSSSMKKAVLLGMLPKELSDEAKVKLAKDCGFEGIEAYPMEDLVKAKAFGDLAREAGVRVHSLMFGGWDAPFSDPDQAVVDKGLKGMETALRSAKAMGADSVLLVPAVVNENVRYVDAYERSQRAIRTLIPLASELNVMIAVEVVWNNFLLSPIEFARYIDEFESPYIQAYFDVANVVAFAWPQDWIRTLGKRIVKVHIKDFKKDTREWTPLYEGSVKWDEVHRAFEEIGFHEYGTSELPGGDEAYLKEVSRRMSLIYEGKAGL